MRCPALILPEGGTNLRPCVLTKNHIGDHALTGNDTHATPAVVSPLKVKIPESPLGDLEVVNNANPSTTPPSTRRELMEDRVREVLLLAGLPNDEHSRETPRRFVDLLLEFCNPSIDLRALLKEGFEEETRHGNGAMVMQEGIPMRGLCAHHLAPFFGTATVAYIPGKRIVGLSKLTRLVQAVGTQSPSTQEYITNTVASVLHEGIDALGTMVVTRAEHTCMAVRGVNAPGVLTTCSALRGNFMRVEAARLEVLGLMRSK